MKTKLKVIAALLALISFGQTAYVYAKAEQKNDTGQSAQTIVDFVNYNDQVKANGGTVSAEDKRTFLNAVKDYVEKNALSRGEDTNKFHVDADGSPGG